ncbi:hypothetical protein JXJ21_22895 [candidate division KSB1 bacterium]|nr:hypothetical protein [candidate division KSB1 bacterium]
MEQNADMEKYNTREFDLIEHVPGSSDIFRRKIWNILEGSSDWNAIITTIDKDRGTYSVVLQGTLKQQPLLDS